MAMFDGKAKAARLAITLQSIPPENKIPNDSELNTLWHLIKTDFCKTFKYLEIKLSLNPENSSFLLREKYVGVGFTTRSIFLESME